MSHCPQCGKPTPEEANVCPFCGFRHRPSATSSPSRTMVGVSSDEVEAARKIAALRKAAAEAAAAPAAGASKANRTIVGMPAKGPPAAAQPTHLPGGAVTAPLGTPSAANRTLVGVARPPAAAAAPASSEALAPQKPAPASGTLLGVARPGIAPLAPGVPRDEEPPDGDTEYDPPFPPGYQPAGELGATIAPIMGAPLRNVRMPGWDGARRRVPRPVADAKPRAKAEPKDRASRRALALITSGGALALAAVLFAVFWPSPPPLTARARADAGGREGVELTCASCPDGTKVSIGDAAATMSSGTALVPLPAALSVGENRFKVAVDRPGNGRDETVGVAVNVAYRIRPDLTALQADRPSFQIVAEAARGTMVAIDGKPVQLAGGRAIENVDVTASLTGAADEVKTLSRQLPYVVTPADGAAERGIVNVSVGIVPLRLDAPGTHVTVDGASFVLAGKTMKGAELLAAGRPITVHADGTFAQVMNVSSVGATQIEVRAKMPGMAPRLLQIKVRRVDNLETAAREFAAESPIGFAQLAGGVEPQIGKAIALAGEVIDARKQGYQTVMLLDVAPCGGASCSVRLVQGAENQAKRGDTLRVFGHVARVFSVAGRPDVPEIEVDFTLKADRGGSPAKDRK